MIKSTRTNIVTTYKSIRNLSACVEKRGRVGMGGWLQFGRGEVGWGRRRGRRRRNRVLAERVYIDFYRWNHRRTRSVGIPVGESTGDRATSLYGDPGLNPSVIPSVKSSEKNPRHHTVAAFQKNYIIRRWYGIIPSVYTDRIADGYCLSVYTDRIGDGIISVGKNYRRKHSVGNSIGFHWFSGSDCFLFHSSYCASIWALGLAVITIISSWTNSWLTVDSLARAIL